MKGAVSPNAPSAQAPLIVDRYAIYDAIASGGMATVHLGRLVGTAGFLRTVAIKRLHGHLAHDPEFTAMFLDEARLASRIQHPNVVSTLDVVMNGGEVLLVMEYVRGESLHHLLRAARDACERIPPRVVLAIMLGALNGLHAAHEAASESGEPLGLVHRDMSPQNVLVGTDGIARVLDFGVAKAAGCVHTTRDGDIKGKVLYMPPEQLAARPLTRTADVYAAGIVLFETLTSIRMFAGENEVASITKIIHNEILLPGQVDPALRGFDRVVRRATTAAPAARYATALEMAIDLEVTCGAPASPAEVSVWVQRLASTILDERARLVAEIERSTTRTKIPFIVQSGAFIRFEAPAEAMLPATTTRAIAVPSQPARPRRSGAMMVGLALLGGLLFGSFVVIAMLLRRGNHPIPRPAAPVAAPLANADDLTVGATATAAVVKHPETGQTPSAVPAAEPPPGMSGGEARAAATGRKAGPARPPNRINCDPPYVVDANGHQHFIPECMK